MTDDAIALRMPDPLAAEGLKRSIDTLKRAVDGVIGRPIEVASDRGRRQRRPAFRAPGDEAQPEHPDDVARYAFDRLL